MTNTIHNVPRELLENLIEQHITAHGCTTETARQAQLMLSAPSPAGVDGLGNTAKLLLPALRQYMHNDGSGLLAGYDLETTQAIIDGLRAAVGAQRVKTCIALKERNDARAERDQQAQRIGELEGLLREESARVDFLDAYIVTAEAPDTGKVAMLADSGTLRECIDFALSAGKEGE